MDIDYLCILFLFIFIIAIDFYITGNLSKDQFKNMDEMKESIEK